MTRLNFCAVDRCQRCESCTETMVDEVKVGLGPEVTICIENWRSEKGSYPSLCPTKSMGPAPSYKHWGRLDPGLSDRPGLWPERILLCLQTVRANRSEHAGKRLGSEFVLINRLGGKLR